MLLSDQITWSLQWSETPLPLGGPLRPLSLCRQSVEPNTTDKIYSSQSRHGSNTYRESASFYWNGLDVRRIF
jgi:hypothetical protein